MTAGKEWRPLAGINVVEFDSPGGVTFASRLLAGMGADVIRVCRPGAVMPGPLAQGRAWISLDLKDAEDHLTASRLIARADVLLEGFRPGVMERLGLGPEACHEDNPGLIYTRLSGWGQSGPLSDKAGHDLNYVAVSGLLDEMTPPGETPRVPPPLFADVAGGGHTALLGVLLALWDRGDDERAGCTLDAAMLDGVVAMLAPQWARLQRKGSAAQLERPFYRLYQTADDRYLAVACLERPFYRRFVTALGLEEASLPSRDEKNSWPELTEEFARRIRSRPLSAWSSVFAGVDACVTPVLTLQESREEPQVLARGLFGQESGGDALQPGHAVRVVGRATAAGHVTEHLTAEDVVTRWSPKYQGAAALDDA